MRQKTFFLVVCSLLGLLPVAAQSEDFTISGIYYFGCDGSGVDAIKASMPVHVGEKHSRDDLTAIKNKAATGVLRQIHRSANEVAVVDCGNHAWNLYISLPGRSVITPAFTAAPQGKEQLPSEGKALYDEMIKALMEMLAGGPTGEDDSRGYSLSLNPNLRDKELALRQWALPHEDEIKSVLKSSAQTEQRRIAAEALGYVDPSKSQIDALVDAAMDDDSTVRNNAVRALACIAGSSKDLAKMIPPARFIAMLNSTTWTDRNKAMFLLTALCKQDPSLPAIIRKQALQALVEISCWDEPHASGARFVLGKVDGLSEEQLNKLFFTGDVEAIVKAAR